MSLLLTIVGPCYNEEAVLSETAQRLLGLLTRLSAAQLISTGSQVCFVDDGSRDATWTLIEQLARGDLRVHGVKLSRNCGHQNALLAGLLSAEGEALVSIDADLQDDVDVIEQMVRKHLEGADIVYGVRSSRRSDTVLKCRTAQRYYRLLELIGVEVIYNHADYRLLSRRALQALTGFSEANLFLRGIIPMLGFRTATVDYVRYERFAGESRYPLRGVFGLAVDGITSLSVAPLRMITGLGLMICCFSMLMILWIFVGKRLTHSVVAGWASSVVPIYLLGGVQLFSIGVLGEYVAKIYLETKRRPRYILERTI